MVEDNVKRAEARGSEYRRLTDSQRPLAKRLIEAVVTYGERGSLDANVFFELGAEASEDVLDLKRRESFIRDLREVARISEVGKLEIIPVRRGRPPKAIQ